MAVRFFKFNSHHLELITVRPDEAAIFGDFQTEASFARVVQMADVSVQAVTAVHDGRVMFCAGFVQLWPGVIEFWMLPSVYAKLMPVKFARTIKRYIHRIQTDFRAHRVQAVSFDDPAHARWMEWLGFKKEGTLEKFTQTKTNMCQYARLQEKF